MCYNGTKAGNESFCSKCFNYAKNFLFWGNLLSLIFFRTKKLLNDIPIKFNNKQFKPKMAIHFGTFFLKIKRIFQTKDSRTDGQLSDRQEQEATRTLITTLDETRDSKFQCDGQNCNDLQSESSIQVTFLRFSHAHENFPTLTKFSHAYKNFVSDIKNETTSRKPFVANWGSSRYR